MTAPEPSAALLACPQCGNPAYFCDKSDHGTVDGPAIHCERYPHHNAFDPDEFPRWDADRMEIPVLDGLGGPGWTHVSDLTPEEAADV